jgi:hypothetical protein
MAITVLANILAMFSMEQKKVHVVALCFFVKLCTPCKMIRTFSNWCLSGGLTLSKNDWNIFVIGKVPIPKDVAVLFLCTIPAPIL